ncbi:CBS domain-containing protein [Candidatus Bathyarchaeota archaeon]|nr:CBS domain-containing protein [Candidatus Bathyarchaeota archaeon]
MNITVKDVMVSPVLVIDAGSTVRVAAEYMSLKEVGSLVVQDEEHTVGIITERDLINRIIVDKKDPDETLVKDIMSEPPVIAVPSLSIDDAVRVMFQYKIKKLIVVEGEGEKRRLVGIVTLTDIARVNPALMLLLKDLFGEEPPPERFRKTMEYYIV